MTITSHTCITIRCDVCNYPYDEDEYTAHFTDIDEARRTLHGTGWTITTDREVICAVQDDAHQAYTDALMPPEPVVQCPGQLGLDDTTGA